MTRTVIVGAACPPAMLREFVEGYNVEVRVRRAPLPIMILYGHWGRIRKRQRKSTNTERDGNLQKNPYPLP
jgi:hypothetical protein